MEILIVPIENEESGPKNSSESYNSNFIRSEINLITTEILLTLEMQSHN